MEWKQAFIILGAVILLFIAVAVMLNYVRVLYRFLACCAAGFAIILLINIALDRVGMHIALNPATILTVGILKIPGAILLAVLNYYFA